MGVIDQIVQMKGEGLEEEDIVKKLQDQGISPKSINDALNNEQIKKAVSDENFSSENTPSQESKNQQNQGNYLRAQEIPEEDHYNPTPQETSSEDYYSPQDNQDYGYQQGSQGFNTGTIIEVSEQVFSQNIQKIQKQIDELNEFKTLTETKVNNIAERLKRMETIIDKLQISILEKIGSYGQNIESVKKEMSMMQDTFGKLANISSSKNNSPVSSEKTSTTRKRK